MILPYGDEVDIGVIKSRGLLRITVHDHLRSGSTTMSLEDAKRLRRELDRGIKILEEEIKPKVDWGMVVPIVREE